MADTGTSIAQLVGQLKTSNANLPAAMSAVGGKEGGGESRSIIVNVNATPSTTQQDTQTEIVNQEKVINSLDRIYGVLMQQLNFNRKEDQQRQMELQVKPQDFQKQMADSQKQVVTAVRESKKEDSSFMSTIGGLVGAFGSFIPKMGGLITAIGGFAPAIATLVAAVAGFKAVSSALSWAAEKLGSGSISPGLGGFFPNTPSTEFAGPMSNEEFESNRIPKTMGGESARTSSRSDSKPMSDEEFQQKRVTTSGEFSKGGSFKENAPVLMNRLMKDYNLSREQAAGVVGNLAHESAGLKAGIQEKGPKKGRGGLGWAQWTGPRRKAFEAYLKETGQAADDPEANYGFLKRELETTHKSALKAVKQESTVSGSMKSFEKKFEAAGVKHYESRQKYAEKAYGMDLSESPSFLSKGIDKLKSWTGIGDNSAESLGRTAAKEGKSKGDKEPEIAKRYRQGKVTTSDIVEGAKKHIGQNERNANSEIKEYLNKFSGTKSKSIEGENNAWCARFTNAVLGEQGIKGTASASARSFTTWGEAVWDKKKGGDLSSAKPGDVAVFSRDNNPKKGHVGIIESIDPKTGKIKLIGGNQGGKSQGGGGVTVSNRTTKDLIAVRRASDIASDEPVYASKDKSTRLASAERIVPEGGRYGEEESEQEEISEPLQQEGGLNSIDAAFAKLGAEAGAEGMGGFGGLATILGGLGGGMGGENLLPKFDEKVAELGSGEEKGKAYAPDFERMTNLLSTIASNTGDMAEKSDEKEEKSASKEEGTEGETTGEETASKESTGTGTPESTYSKEQGGEISPNLKDIIGKPTDIPDASRPNVETPSIFKGLSDIIGKAIPADFDLNKPPPNMNAVPSPKGEISGPFKGLSDIFSKGNFPAMMQSSGLAPSGFGLNSSETQNQQGNNPFGSFGNIFSTAGTMTGGISSIMSGIAGMKGGDARSIINSVNGMLGMGMGRFGGNYPGRSGVDGSGMPNRRGDGFGLPGMTGIPGMIGMGGFGNGTAGTLGGIGSILGGVGGMMGGFGMGGAGGMMGGLGRVLGGVGGMMGGMGNMGGMMGGLGRMIGGMGNMGSMGGMLGSTFGGPLGGLIGSASGGALGGLFNSISSGGGIGDAVSGLLGGALGSTGGVGGILGSLGVTGFGGNTGLGFSPTASREGTGQYPGREGGKGGSLDEIMMKNLGIQREEGFPTMGGMGKEEYLKRQARGETFDPKTGAGSGDTSTPIKPRSMGDIGEGILGIGKGAWDLGSGAFEGLYGLGGSVIGSIGKSIFGDGIASKGIGDDAASMKSSGSMLESLGVSGIGGALGTSSLMSEGSSMIGGALDGLQSSLSSMMGSGSSVGGESSGGGSSVAIGNAGGGGGSGGGSGGGGSPGFKSGDQRAGSSSGAMGIQMGIRNEESILQKAQYSVIRIV